MIEKKRLPIPREDVMAWYADEAHHRMWGEADHCYAYRMYLLGKLDAQQQAEPTVQRCTSCGGAKVPQTLLTTGACDCEQAEPGADERAAFENWMRANRYDVGTFASGEYHNMFARNAWMGWQARAAQSGQRAANLSEATIQALWDEACNDSPQNPGWSRHIRFARAIEQAGQRAGAAEDAYDLGWLHCVEWSGRDDLAADMQSPAYLNVRTLRLKALAEKPLAAAPTQQEGAK